MPKQSKNNSEAQNWWGFPFLCGILITTLVIGIISQFLQYQSWSKDFLGELFKYLSSPKSFLSTFFWIIIPLVITIGYVEKFWGEWGAFFALLTITLISSITSIVLEMTAPEAGITMSAPIAVLVVVVLSLVQYESSP